MICHLFQSPNTKQRTPSGVLFALAGAQNISDPSPLRLRSGMGFGFAAWRSTSSLVRRRAREFSPQANTLCRKRRKHICKQMRTVEDACPYRFCVHFPAVISRKALAISPILCYTNLRKAVKLWQISISLQILK